MTVPPHTPWHQADADEIRQCINIIDMAAHNARFILTQAPTPDDAAVPVLSFLLTIERTTARLLALATRMAARTTLSDLETELEQQMKVIVALHGGTPTHDDRVRYAGYRQALIDIAQKERTPPASILVFAEEEKTDAPHPAS